MSEWVSVKDELPASSQFVIARSIGAVDDEIQTGTIILYYSTAFPLSQRFQSQHRASHVTVTHWMPLPEPPK